LTHINEKGFARMVEVGDKEDTRRTAIARGSIRMAPDTLARIMAGSVKKGDVLAVAQVAGIMAAKRTPEIIPMCHTLMLSGVDMNFDCIEAESRIAISAEVRTTGKTGVEMEALHAVTAAALTIYDMCKAMDKDMIIEGVCLEYKAGGKTGVYQRK
jgi:cyclic pyranopterin phosphate synthase